MLSNEIINILVNLLTFVIFISFQDTQPISRTFFEKEQTL